VPSFCLCGGTSGNITFPTPTTGVLIDHTADATVAVVVESRGFLQGSSQRTRVSVWALVRAPETRRVFVTISGRDPSDVVDGRITCGALSLTVDDARSAVASNDCEGSLDAGHQPGACAVGGDVGMAAPPHA
jgi:hypothetical protein